MENERIDRDTAAAQLAGLQADRAALADRVVQPWWYDVALGLLLFGFVASRALDSNWMSGVALLLFLAGLAALIRTYRRITGVWVNTPPRYMAVWAGIVVAVLVPAFVLGEGEGRGWVLVVAGAVLGAAVTVLSRRWARQYAAELRRGGDL